MRIGIDARLYGSKHTGIGRYTENLIKNLAKLNRQNTYVIFGNPEIKEEILSYPNFEFIPLTTRVYTLAEQLINPLAFYRAKLDLLHVPHFNAPLFYPGKLVITVHDLIKHFSTGKSTTTLPSYQYWFKHLVYRIVVFINLNKASVIVTPSQYWKDYLTKHYSLQVNKVFVTYEAADKKLTPSENIKPQTLLNRYHLKKPFLVYTGNLYPHKNVDLLIDAVREFNKKHEHQLQLALVCARSAFQEKYKEDEILKPLGFVEDSELGVLYNEGLALVQPSFIEGFGLTGLEAMAAGLPVISSSATCLPEVYGDAAIYFDPKNREELIKQIEAMISEPGLADKLTEKGYLRVRRFSWYKTAKLTKLAYKEAFNNSTKAQ